MKNKLQHLAKQNWPHITIVTTAIILIFLTLPYNEQQQNSKEQVLAATTSPHRLAVETTDASTCTTSCTTEVPPFDLADIMRGLTTQVGMLLFLFF